MTESDLKLRLNNAVLRLMLRGPVTTRLLYGDDGVHQVAHYLGSAVADRWLRELACPESEPPGPDTRWRLVDVVVKVKR